MLKHARGLKDITDLRFAFEYVYWMHCELFPHVRSLSRDVFEELRETVVHAITDTLMSDTSQVPFQHDELVKVLDFMPHVETGVGRPCAHFMAVIARVNRRFSQSKFFNFCGKEADRVDSYLSIDKKNSIDRKTIFYRILNLILFGAPEMHTQRLEKIWAVKMGGSAPCWKNYINRRNGEWNSLTIYSTVLLAVNVSFLALPGVETKSTKVLSFCAFAIYLSTMNATGSMVGSLILAHRNHRNKLLLGELMSLRALGTLYGAPAGLLMWAMLYFVLAVYVAIGSRAKGFLGLVMVLNWCFVQVLMMGTMFASIITGCLWGWAMCEEIVVRFVWWAKSVISCFLKGDAQDSVA
ncbi:hypothetical protein BJ138DRAFT_1163047 [Hygrophoropsis aurantiaca]|uniref:Uncharacterized protein n=1 Tax=Hygrophoropsis aurantiaca TaxID=72124 RepID=A0ACB7ZYS3_9AGAM|nr:hypothetical protein BJ138DRAFT_1163047 [Hygrophoropsis aurantiaca]